MIIAITRADGGVSLMTVVTPAEKADRTELIAAEVAKWAEAHAGQYVSHREVAEAHIPTDRTFRDAWTDTLPTPTIDLDMGKARALHMARLRTARDARLAALDVPYQIALERGDKAAQKQIAATKQALRDLPAATDLSGIETPAELAAFVPAALA